MNRTLTVVLSLIIFDKMMMMMMKESAARDNRPREAKGEEREKERLKLGM